LYFSAATVWGFEHFIWQVQLNWNQLKCPAGRRLYTMIRVVCYVYKIKQYQSYVALRVIVECCSKIAYARKSMLVILLFNRICLFIFIFWTKTLPLGIIFPESCIFKWSEFIHNHLYCRLLISNIFCQAICFHHQEMSKTKM